MQVIKRGQTGHSAPGLENTGLENIDLEIDLENIGPFIYIKPWKPNSPIFPSQRRKMR